MIPSSSVSVKKFKCRLTEDLVLILERTCVRTNENFRLSPDIMWISQFFIFIRLVNKHCHFVFLLLCNINCLQREKRRVIKRKDIETEERIFLLIKRERNEMYCIEIVVWIKSLISNLLLVATLLRDPSSFQIYRRRKRGSYNLHLYVSRSF